MKTAPLLCLLLCAAVFPPAAAAEKSQQAKVCTTLGKVHAQRDQQLYAVALQSIDGKLSAQRGNPCIMLSPGDHVSSASSCGIRMGRSDTWGGGGSSPNAT